MRRSIAPSQLSATKRPRFAPQSLGDTGISHVASQQHPKVTDEKSSGRHTGDILQLIKKPCVSNCDINSCVNKEDQRKQPCSSEYRLHEAEDKLSEECDQLSVCQNEEEVGSDRTVETENKAGENEAVQQMCHSNNQIKETREHQLTHKEKPTRAGFKSPLMCTQKSMSMEVGKTQGGYRKFKSPALAGRTPLSQCSNLRRTSQVISNSQADTAEVQPEVKYFNVMWCKLSKKKHKKWEGDAILLTRGRTVSLLDMEGKEIGRGAGYKTSELMTLSEGQSLVVGGKEIEVMGELSEEDYNSGKCFQGAANPSSPPPTTVSRAPSKHKPFKNPQNSSSGQGTANIQVNNAERVVTPCFSPDAPGALVMPRPTQTHQWEHNKQKLPVVDIVVDPHLSVHLRPHQREGVIFLYQCIMGMKNYAGQGAILADEMGLGKTLQCITVLWTLLKQGPYGGKPVIKRVLVITPGSLVKNWSREFRKWLGSERLQVFMVGPDKRVQEFQRSSISPVMIISYEMFVRCYEDLQHVPFDLVVCDEGHRLKNSNIKTTNLVNSLATRRRIVLTGTPVQNDLQELYSLVDFCNPAILGTLAAFRHVYENPIVTAREPRATLAEKELGEMRAAELNRLTSLFILRRTQDINNEYLPPKVEVVLFCKPSALQLGLYRKLVSSRVIRSCLTSKTIDSAQHLMCISALRKLCNHPALIHNAAVQAANQDNHCGDTNTEEGLLYKDLADLYPLDFFDSRQEEHSSKLQVVAEMLQTLGAAPGRHKIVLVSNYTQTLDLLEDLCKSNHYSFLRLDGQTPTTKRQQLVEQFNNKYSQEFVFLLSSKAGGVGLNLIGASRLLLYDIDWNPANDLQAMARVWRDGQRRTVHIYRLLTTGTIEEKMYQRQVSKQGLSGVVVDARTNNKPHFSPEELRDLFQLQENTLCDTHDLLQCSCAGQDTKESVRTRLPNEAPVYRSCQLGLPAQGKAANAQERNISMDELLEWRHIAGPRPQLSHVDQLLPDNLGAVTFAFWTESSSEGVPASVAV